MTRPTWDACYDRLTRAFGRPYDAQQAAIFFDALADVPNERMVKAITRVVNDEKHFPVPAVLRAACDALAAADYRARDPMPWLSDPPMTEAQTADLLALLRATKEKLFGRTLS